MNKFLRVSYIISFLYTLFIAVLGSVTNFDFPIWCFIACYIGILSFMLPNIMPQFQKYHLLARVGGIIIALSGLLFLIKAPISYPIVNLLLVILGFVLAVKLQYNTIHRDFVSKFNFSTILLCLFYALLAMLSSEQFTFLNITVVVKSPVQSAIVNSIPCLVVTLTMGILLLRGLRAASGIVDEKEFNKRQLRDTIIFFVACIAVWATDLLNAIKSGVIFIVENIIVPFFRWIVDLLVRLEEMLINKNPPDWSSDYTSTPYPTKEVTPVPEAILGQQQNYKYSSDFFAGLIYVVLSILIIAVLWWVFSNLLKKGKRAKYLGYPNETRESIDDLPNKLLEKPISRLNRNPRMRIRYIYREFMLHLRRKGAAVKRASTCGEIESSAKEITYKHATEIEMLSNTYRKARYCLENEPTAEDAKLAKKLYDSIVK